MIAVVFSSKLRRKVVLYADIDYVVICVLTNSSITAARYARSVAEFRHCCGEILDGDRATEAVVLIGTQKQSYEFTEAKPKTYLNRELIITKTISWGDRLLSISITIDDLLKLCIEVMAEYGVYVANYRTMCFNIIGILNEYIHAKSLFVGIDNKNGHSIIAAYNEGRPVFIRRTATLTPELIEKEVANKNYTKLLVISNDKYENIKYNHIMDKLQLSQIDRMSIARDKNLSMELLFILASELRSKDDTSIPNPWPKREIFIKTCISKLIYVHTVAILATLTFIIIPNINNTIKLYEHSKSYNLALSDTDDIYNTLLNEFMSFKQKDDATSAIQEIYKESLEDKIVTPFVTLPIINKIKDANPCIDIISFSWTSGDLIDCFEMRVKNGEVESCYSNLMKSLIDTLPQYKITTTTQNKDTTTIHAVITNGN